MQIATNRPCVPLARLHRWCGLLSTVVVLSLAQFFPIPEEEFLEDEAFSV